MKPNTEQQVQLDRLAKKNMQIKTHRLEARVRLEALLEQELNVLLVEQSQIANAALKAGVSKTRIGRAMGTTNWNTVTEVLTLTESDTTEETVETPRTWDYDPATMVLTLHEYQQRFTTKMIADEVVIPGEMRHVMEDYTVRPIRFPEDVEVPWLNAIYKEIGRDQGMILPPQAPAAEVDGGGQSIEEQFWAQAGSENDDEEWDSE